MNAPRRPILLAGAAALVLGGALLGGTWALASGLNSTGGGTRVTQLPACASANDEQVVLLQTAPMAAEGITWRLKCNSASASAYDWEFVGGGPLYAEVAADETIAAATTTYADATTVGPALTLPAGGDYTVEIGFRGYPWAQNQTLSMSYQIGATAASDADAATFEAPANLGNVTTRTRLKTGLAEGTTLTAKYQHSSSAAAGNFAQRFIQVTPVRLAPMTTTGGAAPVVGTTPSISGTPRVGATLVARPGTWSNLPTGYAYQWQRTLPGGTYDDIPGADSQVYIPVEDDYGYTLRVQVTARNATGPTTATSAATDLIGSQLVTSFPANPEDGQLVTYQNATMAAQGVEWEFMYNATSASTYKWEFVGGTPLMAEVFTQQSTASASWADLATVGPSITVPLAGDYDYRFRARTQSPGSSKVIYTGIAVNGSAPAGDDQSYIYDTTAGSHEYEQSYERRRSLASGDVVKLQYLVSGGGSTAYWATRRLLITPVRVG